MKGNMRFCTHNMNMGSELPVSTKHPVHHGWNGMILTFMKAASRPPLKIPMRTSVKLPFPTPCTYPSPTMSRRRDMTKNGMSGNYLGAAPFSIILWNQRKVSCGFAWISDNIVSHMSHLLMLREAHKEPSHNPVRNTEDSSSLSE